jgi:hypothetical protein
MTYIKLKEIKARIFRLHSEERREMIDTEERNRLPHESPSIYHILRTKKRQNMRSISVIKDTQGQDHTDILSIKKTLTLYFTEKYGHTSVNKDQIRSIGAQIPRKLPTEANDDLEAQISMEEVKEAFKKGRGGKHLAVMASFMNFTRPTGT